MEAALVLSGDHEDAGSHSDSEAASEISGGAADGRWVTRRHHTGTLGEQAARLNDQLAGLEAGERLARFRHEVGGRIVLTTSFGLEAQVILHLVATGGLDIEIATLDTGRLFPETYRLWAETEQRYGRRIEAFWPQHAKLEAIVKEHGVNGFYDSRQARLACCHARKVEPLDRALAGAAGWIAGLRASQSNHREATKLVSVDERKLLKFSPLFDWSREEVQAFAAANDVPTNPLHAKGYASIGCAPCTRPIAPDEPERAGRWWWEEDDKKECGLHLAAAMQAVGAIA